MLKKVFIFLSGFVCGALILGGVVFIKDFLRDAEAKMKMMDNTDVYSDIEVRQKIKQSGISLPESSWNLFYADAGVLDPAVWITATMPQNEVWEVIKNSLHKNREDFTNGVPESYFNEVERGKDQKIDTSLWTPKNIKNPLHFHKAEKGGYFEDWVVDEERGRIFVMKVNT